MQWLNEFLTAYGRAVTNSGESAWFPFSYYRLYPRHYDLDLKRWQFVLETAKRKGITPAALATTITGPMTARTELHFALQAAKVANEWETGRGQGVANFLNEINKNRTASADDRYGLYSAKLHNNEEIETLTQRIPWFAVNQPRARIVGNLVMAAIHATYAYYCDYCYFQWFEILGPYKLPGRRQLIIRRFSNFQPTEVWSGPFASFRSLDIFTVYRGSDIMIDQWSHIASQENLAEHLESTAVLKDGIWVEPEVWPTIVNELGQIAADLQNQWRALDFEQKKQKVLELRWYMFRDLFNMLGLDWRPTDEMRERIRNRELLPEITPTFSNIEEAREWWMQFLDPRTQAGLPESYQEPWKQKELHL